MKTLQPGGFPMNLYDDPFFCVPRRTHATSQGPVDLPIFYREATAVMAFFGCAREGVEAALPGERMVPALTWGSRALVGLAFFDYRRTSIGAYREVGLAVPVLWRRARRPWFPWLELFRSADTRRLGFHVLDLPVTTKAADAAGRELWGYPKFVTAIDIRLSPGRFDGKVHRPDGGGPILELAGRPGPGLGCPSLDLVTFERRNDQDRRTIIRTRGAARLRTGGDVTLTLGGDTHPMTRRLKRLGLNGRAPIFMTVDSGFQSRLHAGAPLEGV
jgi:hypothetical protein